MSYPRYHNVQRIEGGAMSFEAYLKQIRLLYPNIPDLYVHYLQLIYEFNAEQLDRLLQLQEEELAAAIFSATLTALQNAKDRGPEAFMAFVEAYQFKDIVAQLFEIAGLSFEEWLEVINTMYPEEPDRYLYYMDLLGTFKTLLQQKHLPMSLSDPVISNILDTVFHNDLQDAKTYMYHATDNDVMTLQVDPVDGVLTELSLGPYIAKAMLHLIDTYHKDNIHRLGADYSNQTNIDITLLPAGMTSISFDHLQNMKELAPDMFMDMATHPMGPMLKQRAIELFDIQGGEGVTIFSGRPYAIDTQMVQQSPGSNEYNHVFFGDLHMNVDTPVTGGLNISGRFHTPVKHTGFELYAFQMYPDGSIGSTFTIGFTSQTLSFEQYPAIHSIYIPISMDMLPRGNYKLVLTMYAYDDNHKEMNVSLSGLNISLIANNFTCTLDGNDRPE